MPGLARRLAAAWGLLASAAAAWAQPVPMAVAPVSARLNPGTEFGQFEVSNRGERATGVEVELKRVRWDGGAESYEATQDIVATPPVFRLEPGKARALRFRYVGQREQQDAIYRVFIRQLPEQAKPQDTVQMTVTLAVPVFVSPVEGKPALALARADDGASLRNTGNVTLTIQTLGGSGCPGEPFAVGARLFPGQSASLKGRPPACASTAVTDRGPVELSRN